jgi:hypothetical protein
MDKCKECGMPVTVGEYHPYAACLMFKACLSSDIVQANMDAVQAHGYQLAIDLIAKPTRLFACTRRGFLRRRECLGRKVALL